MIVHREIAVSNARIPNRLGLMDTDLLTSNAH